MLASKTCATCDCDKLGSVSPKCDTSGKCTCRNTFYGKKCSNKDCEVGDWAAWSTCKCENSKTKTRTRKVTSTFLGNGKECSVLTETGQCTMVECKCLPEKPGFYGPSCENRDCQWGPWSNWVDCPSGCPIQNHERARRTRDVRVTKVGNGKDCSGSRTEESPCLYYCFAYDCLSPGGLFIDMSRCKYKKFPQLPGMG